MTTTLPTRQPLQLASLSVDVPLNKGTALYRELAATPKPLPVGAITAISRKLKIGRTEFFYVLKLQRLFEEQPALKAQWEEHILSGRMSPRVVVERLTKHPAQPPT